MKPWSRSHMILATLLGSVIVLVLWVRDQYQYQALDAYSCKEIEEFVIPGQDLLPQDGLELYVGGWIERGEVTISGLPSRDNGTIRFSRGSSVSTISHAYIGEWYEPNISIMFEPSEASSCLIRVVYRYK